MGQLAALAITIAVEVPVAIAWLIGWRWIERSDALRAAAVVAAASLLTHPVAWWAARYGLPGWPWEHKVIVIEASVIVVETAIVALALRQSGTRALAIATLANAASFGVGVLLT